MKESERGICFNMLSQNGIFKGVWIKTSDTKKSVPNKRTYLSQSCWLASIADMWVLKQNSLQKFKKKKARMKRKKKNNVQVVGNANNTSRKGSCLCRVERLLHSSWEEWWQSSPSGINQASILMGIWGQTKWRKSPQKKNRIIEVLNKELHGSYTWEISL